MSGKSDNKLLMQQYSDINTSLDKYEKNII